MEALSTYTTGPQTNSPVLPSSKEITPIQKVVHKILLAQNTTHLESLSSPRRRTLLITLFSGNQPILSINPLKKIEEPFKQNATKEGFPSVSQMIMDLTENPACDLHRLLAIEDFFREEFLSPLDTLLHKKLKNHIFRAYQALFSHPKINEISESNLVEILRQYLDRGLEGPVLIALLSPFSRRIMSADVIVNLTSSPTFKYYIDITPEEESMVDLMGLSIYKSCANITNDEGFAICTLAFKKLEECTLDQEKLGVLATVINKSHELLEYKNDQHENLYRSLIQFITKSEPISFLKNSINLIDPCMLWMFLENQAFESLTAEDLKQIKYYFQAQPNRKTPTDVIDRFYQALYSHPSYQGKSILDF